MFCNKVFTFGPSLVFKPGAVPEIRTSTRMPGTINPETPTTSFTRTAQARIPGRIVAAKPPPEPAAASLFSKIGSP